MKLLHADVNADDRGWLVETWQQASLVAQGMPASFAQENRTLSQPFVLRGLHYQLHQPQGKLVSVICGEIYDVAVDLRPDSPTLGQHLGQLLSDQTPTQLWVPEGFAHGFYVTRGPAVVSYKLTASYAPQWERCLAWDDPTLAIPWPLQGPPRLSQRDRSGRSWAQLQADLGDLSRVRA